MSTLIIADIDRLEDAAFHSVVNLISVGYMMFEKVVYEAGAVVNLGRRNHCLAQQSALLINLVEYLPKSLFFVFRMRCKVDSNQQHLCLFGIL